MLVLRVVRLDRKQPCRIQLSTAKCCSSRSRCTQARARGTVATAIAARVYQADGIDEACSSCDERKTRQRSAVHRFASSVVAKSQAKARARRRVPVALRHRRQKDHQEHLNGRKRPNQRQKDHHLHLKHHRLLPTPVLQARGNLSGRGNRTKNVISAGKQRPQDHQPRLERGSTISAGT